MSDERAQWRAQLKAFFDQRGDVVLGRPSFDELCFIAGRDPRVWRDERRLAAMATDLCEYADIGADHSVLEIGCAAGLLATLVAPHCRRYTGIDLAESPLKVARRLGLPNATFQEADGGALPFADGIFDSVFCCDVFTNFPSAQDCVPLIREMLRVAKPGRPVLISNVPDKATARDLPRRVSEIIAEAEAKHGPLPPPPNSRPGYMKRIAALLNRLQRDYKADPIIVTYEFDRIDFVRIAHELDVELAMNPIHPDHPYHGFRFNAVFRRRQA